MTDDSPPQTRRYGITDHALKQARKRISRDVTLKDLANSARRSHYLFTAPDGEQYRVGDIGRGTYDLVFVVDKRRRNVATIVTTAMAFADCPKAVFYTLMSKGLMASALSLRAKGNLRELPRAIEKQYHYPRTKAGVAWELFQWMTD